MWTQSGRKLLWKLDGHAASPANLTRIRLTEEWRAADKRRTRADHCYWSPIEVLIQARVCSNNVQMLWVLDLCEIKETLKPSFSSPWALWKLMPVVFAEWDNCPRESSCHRSSKASHNIGDSRARRAAFYHIWQTKSTPASLQAELWHSHSQETVKKLVKDQENGPFLSTRGHFCGDAFTSAALKCPLKG